MQFRQVQGMHDILPEQVGRWQRLEATFRRVVEAHAFSELRTPLVEPTALFVRSIGDATDIVEKEMFVLEREGESLALRPEGTASAARAFVEHAVHAREPVTRWYYLGAMFRAERPQRGRQRQFHQAGCEVYGDPGPWVDAELMELVLTFLREAGCPELELHVSSLGGPETRARYRDALVAHLTPRAAALSETSQRRLATNPLRVLDSKDPADQAVVAGAPSLLDLLEGDDRAHWDELLASLDSLGVPYVVDPALVRGLDYYTRTLFEVRSSAGGLGAQNTLVGGGRYDAMIGELGGPPVPAIGFALGLERLLLATEGAPAPTGRPRCFVAPLGARARREALGLARELRASGAVVEVDTRGGSLKSLLRRADSLGSRLCLVLGDGELDRGVVQVKDLASHERADVPRGALVEDVRRRLAGAPGSPE
ncbi:MAG: histidine--tRNA ligase [Polyangiaceae bacterium]|nr:histidine--tRNA ligase [Polyangiaceae bacterium]